MYLGRVHHEEQMMPDAFGEDYTAYRRSTGRLLPTLTTTRPDNKSISLNYHRDLNEGDAIFLQKIASS